MVRLNENIFRKGKRERSHARQVEVIMNILDTINQKLFHYIKSKKAFTKLSTLHIRKQNNRNEKSFHSQSGFQTSLFILILIFCTISMWLVKANALHNAKIQEGIAADIIRFHVIANSDSSEDQALKLKVKDKLVESLSPLLKNAASITEARSVISSHLTFIQATAENTIQQYGYRYPVKVSLENCYFPLKVYGNCTFPPGIYEALRVRIGAAEGKNWWCVMFPPLCFVDETYSVVDENTSHKLKHLLTEEEYNTLINQKKPIKIKFKLWEELKKLFD
jgi:stage II sporulation protein R